MEQNFWEKEYKDFVDGVVIKFKKMSSLDVLDLADRNIGKNGDSKEYKLDCLKNVVWTRDGSNWFDLMDENGNSNLQGLTYSTLLDIFYEFRRTVCLPVFTESRAYQDLLKQQEKIKGLEDKKHKDQQ